MAEFVRRVNWIDVGLKAFCVLVAIYVLSPLVFVILHSFNTVAYSVFPPEGLSLRWYQHLATQSRFLQGFINSVLTATGTTVLAMVIGLMTSLAVVRYNFFGKPLLSAYVLLPLVAPKIVLGLALFIVFVGWGLYGGLAGLVLAHCIITLPLAVAVLTATLKRVPRALEEAAMDLGARPLRVLWEVVLPQISTGIVVSASLVFIVSFDQVETSIFLVRPRNYTLPLEMFVYMEKWQDPSIAALSTLMIVGVTVVAGLGIVLLKRLQVSASAIPLVRGVSVGKDRI